VCVHVCNLVCVCMCNLVRVCARVCIYWLSLRHTLLQPEHNGCCNHNTHRVTIGCMYILHLSAFFILNHPGRRANRTHTHTHLGARTTPRTIPAHTWSGPAHTAHTWARSPHPLLSPVTHTLLQPEHNECCNHNTHRVAIGVFSTENMLHPPWLQLVLAQLQLA
jgi:hypothetical protein